MLTYHPDVDLYIAGCKGKGYISIDKDSAAYAYCHYLRFHFGGTDSRDLDGQYCISIMVSEYRVDQVFSFVKLENIFKYLMSKEL